MPAALSRRRVLQTATIGAGTLLAGCSSRLTAPSPDATTREPALTDTLQLSVTVRQSFTSAHPAQLRVSMTNAGSLPVQLITGPSGLVSEYTLRGVETTNTLSIFPPDPENVRPADSNGTALNRPLIPETPRDGCWQPPAYDTLLVHPLALGISLDPGETHTDEYVLLDGPGEGCLAAGRYRLRERYSVAWDDSQTRTRTHRPSDIEISFTVEVSEEQAVRVVDADVSQAQRAGDGGDTVHGARDGRGRSHV